MPSSTRWWSIVRSLAHVEVRRPSPGIARTDERCTRSSAAQRATPSRARAAIFGPGAHQHRRVSRAGLSSPGHCRSGAALAKGVIARSRAAASTNSCRFEWSRARAGSARHARQRRLVHHSGARQEQPVVFLPQNRPANAGQRNRQKPDAELQRESLGSELDDLVAYLWSTSEVRNENALRSSLLIVSRRAFAQVPISASSARTAIHPPGSPTPEIIRRSASRNWTRSTGKTSPAQTNLGLPDAELGHRRNVAHRLRRRHVHHRAAEHRHRARSSHRPSAVDLHAEDSVRCHHHRIAAGESRRGHSGQHGVLRNRELPSDRAWTPSPESCAGT